MTISMIQYTLMWQLPRRKQNNILLHVVDLGDRKIKIPVAMLGDGEGPMILITGGMDGDEYGGIDACYALIEKYSKEKFHGRLVIIPIVNIPGFEKAVSWNPLDMKYPKHIFPGKEKGTSTERLMYWLSTNFVQDSDMWIDLHSGASTEVLAPFVWVWETKQKQMNETVQETIKTLKADRIVLQSRSDIFVENIARKKTTYVLFESGELGKRDKKTIKQHVDWVSQLLSNKGIKKSTKKVNIYREVNEIRAEKDGVWVPLFFGQTVKKHAVLGEVRSLDGKILQKITASEHGVFLWRREAMSVKKGDDIYAFAYNMQKV